VVFFKQSNTLARWIFVPHQLNPIANSVFNLSTSATSFQLGAAVSAGEGDFMSNRSFRPNRE